MRKIALFTFVLMLIPTPVIAANSIQPNYGTSAQRAAQAAVDRAMVRMLTLRDGQIEGYLSVMRGQRRAYLAVPGSAVERRLEIYEETIELLRPILDGAQLAQFAAYTRSVIIEIGSEEQVTLR